jgi:WD40 repeat protein
VAVTPDGKRALSGSSKDILSAWDLETGAMISSFAGESEMTVFCATPDGRTIAVGERSGRVRFLRLEIGDQG